MCDTDTDLGRLKHKKSAKLDNPASDTNVSNSGDFRFRTREGRKGVNQRGRRVRKNLSKSVYLALVLSHRSMSSSHLKVTTLTAGGLAGCGGVEVPVDWFDASIFPFDGPNWTAAGLRGWKVWTIFILSRNLSSCWWTSS